MFHRIPIPAGLERTLEDLSREVLRHQPHNVYQFCADFFHTRLTAREGETEGGELRWYLHTCIDFGVVDAICQQNAAKKLYLPTNF